MSGQKIAFTPDQVTRLERILSQENRIRDLALWLLGKDTSLRSIDLLSLTLADVCWSGGIKETLSIKQRKTGRYVKCTLSEATRSIMAAYVLSLSAKSVAANARLFPITTRHYRRLVKEWCEFLRMDGTHYSTHSVRRTVPTHIYRHTKDLVACQILLGHASPAATVRYINMGEQEAHELKAQFPI